jgi:replication factor A1
MIDVIAVLTEVQTVMQIQIKSTGEFRDKRSITLTDDTGVNIMATLWGDISNNEKLQEGAIIAVKGAKVSEYGGKSLNIDSGSVFLIDPQEEERYH